jgi:hypothetical protein
MVKNIKDGRVVLKHNKYDRFYVSDPIAIPDLDTELYTTEDINEAYDVLKATQYHWAGISVDGWRVVEAYG